MVYMRLLKADSHWLLQEIEKGNIFYKEGWYWLSCGPVRHHGFSVDSLSVNEVLRMIKKGKNIYWRNG